MQNKPRSAYVHVPFCRHRCGYCNFTLIAGRDDLVEQFLAAFERELSSLAKPTHIETLFIGGGTPSHLNLKSLRQFLELLTSWLTLAENSEFSVEANPSDISFEKIELLAEFGVNRLSLGCQSFDSEKLQVLERDHDAIQIRRAVEIVRQRIKNVSLDLIFGVPGESRQTWQNDLRSAIDLDVQHVSTYGLTIEKGTTFWNRRLHGELVEQNDNDELWMYEYAIDTLRERGFEHYEVSNFAKTGFACKHNQIYWNCGEYYGFGPGAASHLNRVRTTNHRSTTTYIRKMLVGETPVAESEELSEEARLRERIVFGMRQMKGVNVAKFEVDTYTSLESLLGKDTLKPFFDNGLVEMSETGNLRLTRKGLVVSDSIWPYLL